MTFPSSNISSSVTGISLSNISSVRYLKITIDLKSFLDTIFNSFYTLSNYGLEKMPTDAIFARERKGSG